MAELPGDATPEEAKEKLLKDLRGRIASASATNPVTLSAAEAVTLLEAAGGTMEPDDEDAPSVAPKNYQEFAEREHPAPTEEDKAKEAKAAKAAPQAAAPQQAGTAKHTRAQLNEMTKDELMELADDEDVDVAASWSKADIVDAILKHK
jgi:hypothetical protein